MPEEINKDKTKETKIDPPLFQSHSGKTIVPISDQSEISNNKESDDEEEPTQSEKVKPAEVKKEAPTSTDLNIDSLSSNNIDTKDTQQPRIYDTKQYYVPINDTKHKHGFIVGTIIAGVVTAVLAVSVLVIISMSA